MFERLATTLKWQFEAMNKSVLNPWRGATGVAGQERSRANVECRDVTQLARLRPATPMRLGAVSLLFVALAAFESQAATPYVMSGGNYSEAFGDIANWANGFTGGIGANCWGSVAVTAGVSIPDGVKTTVSTATFTTSTTAGVQKGSGNILLLSTGSSDNTTSCAIDLFLDFTGRNAGTLGFDYAEVANSTGNRTGSIRVYTSTDGTTFTELTGAAVLNVINNVASSGSITSVALPASFNGSSTARIRFYYYNGTGGTTGSRPKISIDNVAVTSTASGGLTPPTLTAAGSATVDGAFNVTFTDSSAWRSAITAVTVGGTTLTAGYSVSAGQIAFTPSASAPASLLQTSGTKSIVVKATGYNDATVSQTIGVGAATKLSITTQPAAPSGSGGTLVVQPVVTVQDQYGNTVTGSSAPIAAAVGAGSWTIGGTTSKNAASGVATFTDLSATSAGAVSGATISFTSSGLTGATSSGFNILAPSTAFTDGNLAVLLGDNISANSTMTILELSPSTANQSSPLNTIPISATGANALRISASAGTCGRLADSGDGTLLAIAAFKDANSTTADEATITARGVGTLDKNHNFVLQASYTGTSANQIRCATSPNNTTWYMTDKGGIYLNGTTTPANATNVRSIRSFGGTIYVLSANATPFISKVSADGTTLTSLTGLASTADSATVDFYMMSSANNGTYDTLYVLDMTSATVGAIKKFSFDGSTWTSQGSYTTAFGGDGLCVARNGGSGAYLYVTTGAGGTAANQLLKLADTAAFNAAISITTGNNVTLYTAPAGTTMKGVAFAPVVPTITGAATATAFTTTYGTPSAAQTFSVSGINLNANLVATAPAGFEVSSDGTTYGGTATFTQSGGSASGTLYVRLAATAAVAGTYNSQNIVLSSTGATSVNITAAGSGNGVTAKGLTITANNVVKPYSTTLSSPVVGSTAFASSGLVNSETIGSVTITYGTGAAASDAGGTYTGQVTPSAATGGSFTAGNYAINYVQGDITVQTTPVITLTGGPLHFNAVAVNGTSAEQTYTVAGAFLTGDITIAPPTNFEVSTTSGSGFVVYPSTLTLTQSGGTVTNTTLYVHFKPTAQQTYSAVNITHASAGATAQNIAVDGVGANAPSVSTQAPASTNATGATLSGTVTANNGATLSDRGFYYKTAPGVSLADTKVSEGGTSVAAYNYAVTGLNPDAVYYYRAYAVNAIGTTLDSADVNFNTLANAPTAPTVGSPATNSLVVSIGAGDGNPSTTTYAIQETTSANYVQANGTLGASPVFQTAAAWASTTVKGLTPATSYTFQSKAMNGASVQTVFGPTANAFTLSLPFAAGDLAVLSADVATANNTTFTILELNAVTAAQSSPVQSIAINGTSGTNALRTSGSASSTGYLSDSSDGSLLAFAAHNTTSSSGNANSFTNRGVGTLSVSGAFNLAATYVGVGGLQTRGASSVDNGTWYVGDQSGIYTNGALANLVSGTLTNIRSVKAFGGTVYAFISSTLCAPVSTLSATATTLTGLPGLANGASTRQDFSLVSSGTNGPTYDILYILDASSATAGTIFKYSLVGGSWTANGTYTTTFGGFGLCAARSGAGGAALYVTTGTGATANNNVIKLVDAAGYNATISVGSAVTLYTAPSGTMKGIAFAPNVATEPVAQANGVNFSGVGATSLTVNWTNGNGARRIVVVSQGSAVSYAPTDNFAPAGVNAKFSDAADQGSGNRICYDGTGSSVALTGLSAGGTYYVTVYEYNVSGLAVNYLTSGSPATGSQTTLTTPTLTADPTSANVEATTATLGGSVAATGGDTILERGIYWSTLNGFTPPAQGTKDSETGAFGAGDFTRSTIGLPAGTAVYFKSFASNSVGASFSANQGSILTKPAAPAAQAADGTISSGFTAHWLAATGATNYFLDVSTDNAFGSFVSGYNNLAVGNLSSLAVSGLSALQTYYYQVRAQNATGLSTNSAVITAQTTASVSAPAVSTPSVANVTTLSADLGGTIVSTNNASVTEWGVYWSPTSGFTPPGAGTKVAQTGATGNGAFALTANGFSAGTPYYFRAYAVNSVGTNYTSEANFLTLPDAPAIAAATGLTATAFYANWNTAVSATNYLLDVATDSGFGSILGGYSNLPIGNVTTWPVSGLSRTTVYYYRLRAQNGTGISTNSTYAAATTLAALPAAATSNNWVTGVTNAAGGGNVTDDGGDSGVVGGVCYGMASSPAIVGAHTVDGNGIGSFVSTLNGLAPNTKYYVRAYATNSVGIAYGNETNFTTAGLSAPTNLQTPYTNSTGFTGQWDAVSAATSYLMDVSTNAAFGTAGGVLSTNAYYGGNQGAGWPTNSWTDSSGQAASGYLRLLTNSVLLSPVLDFTSSSGQWLSFFARTYNGVVAFNNTITVSVSTDAGSTWSVLGTRVPASSTLAAQTPFDLSSYAGMSQVRVKFQALTASATIGAGVSAIAITNTTTILVPSYVAGYSNRQVLGTSQAVTNLTVNNTYYWRVAAACASSTSAVSSTQTVFTAAPLAPGVAVLGNGLTIANSAASPAAGNGTDFGNVGLMGVVVTNTFTVTNNGTAALTLGAVASTLADFSIVSQPAASVGAGLTTTFQVAFAPAAAGLRQATIGFANNATNYAFAVQGQAVAAGIACSPAALSDAATIGSSPAQSFAITNVGLGILSYTITTNAGWLSVSPVSGTLAAGAGQTFVVQYATTGLQAGTSNATITVTDGNASNSPQTVSVSLDLSAAAAAPSVNTPSSTSVGTTTATLGGNVAATNGASVTEWGVYYSTSSGFAAPNGTKLSATGNRGTGAFTVSASGLTSGSTYYFQAYAVNSVGTNYTGEASFTTLTGPTVVTAGPTATNATGATLSGNVTVDGGSTVTNRGVCYKTSAGVTIADNPTADTGSGLGAYTVNVTGLAVNTLYYFKAYAMNTAGESLGAEANFTTYANVPVAPVVGGATASSLTVAIGAGDGNPAATTYAILETSQGKYVQADGTLGASAVYQTAVAWGTKTVTGLSGNTTYTFEAKAQNGASVATTFGAAASGTTVKPPFLAGNLVVERLGDGVQALANTGNTIFFDEFNTSAAGQTPRNIIQIPDSGSTAFIDSGSAGSDGAVTRSADGRFLCFPGYNVARPYASSLTAATAAAVPRGAGTVDGNGNYTFAAAGNFYSGSNIRGAATDGAGNYWGSGGSAAGSGIYYFGTNAAAANVYSANLRNVGLFNGNLWYSTSAGTPGYGLWKFTGKPTTAVGNTATRIITTTAVNSPYAFAVNTAEDTIYYADDGSGSAPKTPGIHKLTYSGAAWSEAYIVNTNAVFGLVADWSTTPATLYATTGSGVASNNLIKVQDNGAGSALTILANAGASRMFRGVAFAPITPTAPTVTVAAASSVATTTATLNGNVTSDGGSTITDRGFCYKTSTGVAIGDNKTTVAGTTGAYTLGLSSLSANVQYFTIAYASNAVGVTLSAETNFWTLANAPAVLTTANITASGVNLTLGAGDGNSAATVYAITETTQGKFVQADGSLGVSAVYQTAAAWGTKTVTGLAGSTTYTFEAKAQNGAGLDTAYGPTVNVQTATPANPPGVTTAAFTPMWTWASGGGTVTSNGGAAVTAYGVCYGTSANPDITGAHTTDGSGTATFASTPTGLIAGTIYHVRAYATNLVGIAYGSDVTFTTKVTAAVTVALRPQYVDLAATTSSNAVLMTVGGYASASAPRYRLYNGSNQYNCWDVVSGTFVSSSSYTSGPLVVGDYVGGTTFWIPYQVGNNSTVTASYRDRLSPYSANNLTAALPTATQIGASPFKLTGTLAAGGGYDLSVRYVVLGFDAPTGGNLLFASFSELASGFFAMTCQNATTVQRVEIRTLTNTVINAATKTGTWSAGADLGTISLGLVPATAPTVTSPSVTLVTDTGAALGGTIAATNGASVTEWGVYWSASAGFTPPSQGTKVSQTGAMGLGAFTVPVSGLPSGSAVYYAAFASNSAGAGYSTSANFWTLPATPVAVAASATNVTSFTAAWNAASGATNYLIDVATDAGFTALVAGYSNVSAGSATSYAVSGLTPTTFYYYRLRAQNAGGINTNNSNAITVETTGITAPTILAVSSLPNFGLVTTGLVSAVQTYTVSATNLTGDLTIAAPPGIQIAASGSFGSSLTFANAGGVVAPTVISARFAPTQVGAYAASITNSSAGAATVLVAVSGTGALPVDGAGTVTLVNNNGDALRGTTVFRRNQMGQSVSIAITGVSSGTVESVSIAVPWAGLSAANVSLSGAGFGSAVSNVVGSTLTISGAAIDNTQTGVVTIAGLTTRDVTLATDNGNDTWTINTKGLGGSALTAIASSPTTLVTVPNNLLRTLDGVGKPVRTNITFASEGTVSAVNISSTNYLQLFVQDGVNGGICMYMNNKPMHDAFTNSDHLYVAQGTLVNYNGLIEFTPSTTNALWDLGPATPVSPRTMTLTEALTNGEAYESTLVRVIGVTFPTNAWPAVNGSANIALRDASTNATLRVLPATDVPGHPPTGTTFAVVGVLQQYKAASPYFGGWQVSPRSTNDFANYVVAAQDGLGTAVVLNNGSDALNGRTFFHRNSSGQAVRVTVSGVNGGAMESVQLGVPWSGLSVDNVTLTGAGFSGAAKSVSGTNITITGAALTDTQPGNIDITGLTSRDVTNVTDVGQDKWTVSTKAQGGTDLAPIGGSPVSYVTVPISSVRAVDAFGGPVLTGQTVVVEGACTSAGQFYPNTYLFTWIQDATGGACFYTSGTNFYAAMTNIGHAYAIKASVNIYRGLTELYPTTAADIVDLGSTSPVLPKVMTLSQLLANAEPLESSLVSIPSLTLTSGIWPTNTFAGTGTSWYTNLTVSESRSGLSATLRLWGTTTLNGSTLPGSNFTVTAVVGQFTTNVPAFDGYLLMPRTTNDVAGGVAITNVAGASVQVSNRSSNYGLAGTCDPSAVSLTWSNVTTGAGGTVSSPFDNWTAVVPLVAGSNFVTVSATFASGAVAMDAVTIVRSPFDGSVYTFH